MSDQKQGATITPFPLNARMVKEHEKITLIASGKGGVGKTWFSITLAQAMGKRGQKTLVFDGDLGLANIDIQLGLTPEKDLSHVVSGEVALKDAIYSYQEGGFDILPGRSGSGLLGSIPMDRFIQLQEGVKELAESYDRVFMDLGAGIGGTVKNLSRMAGVCILIMTDEPTSLTDGYAFLKVIHRLHPTLKFQIVINQADNLSMGQRTFDSFAKVCDNFLKFTPELLGVVRRDTHVKETIRSQTPILVRFPNCDAAKDMEKIVEKLLT